jgi:hypothetical protein
MSQWRALLVKVRRWRWSTTHEPIKSRSILAPPVAAERILMVSYQPQPQDVDPLDDAQKLLADQGVKLLQKYYDEAMRSTKAGTYEKLSMTDAGLKHIEALSMAIAYRQMMDISVKIGKELMKMSEEG